MRAPLILIAEDTPDVLMVLIELLESEGYRVHTAGDGQAALDYLNNCIHCPDMVITDIMMPRMNGIQLVEAIRLNERFEAMPIAIYSASSYYKDRAQELACEFLAKPFDITQVFSLINTCLKKEKVCTDTQN